jgi:hypothetical protein
MEFCLALLKPTAKAKDAAIGICLEVRASRVQDSKDSMKTLNSNWTTSLQPN